MSYSDEIVLSKLSTLNETQEGIVSIAQWVMFHRRYAKRTADLWLQRLKESTSHRKLNLIYLANEVCQQSRNRRKEEFLNAFSPIIAEATEVAIHQSPPDIQQKIKRVVQVWRQRQIFDNETLNQIEARAEAAEKGKSAGAIGRRIGGGIGGGIGGTTGVPQELQKLVSAHQALSGKLTASTIAVGSANTEYAKHMETTNIPAPPVYAARLSQLMKTLDNAHTAVQDAITARSELVKNLESLLEMNKAALTTEQQQFAEIEVKRRKTDQTKKEVENKILSGLDQPNNDSVGQRDGTSRSMSPEGGFKSPDVEALTPPPAEETFDPTPQPPMSATHLDILQGNHGFYGNAPDLFSTLSALNGGALKNNTGPTVDEMGGMDELDSEVADMIRKEAEAAGRREQRPPQKRDFTAMMQDEDDEYRP